MRILIALMLLLTAVAAPAFATEETSSDEMEVVETFDGAEPAVILDSTEGAEPEPAWTFRYLVPTFLVLTLLGVGVTAFRWFRLRSRYQIVE